VYEVFYRTMVSDLIQWIKETEIQQQASTV
jgi:hypothetical protein